MKKLIAVLVASAFALASTALFAADTAKRDEMTPQEKAELRQRADRLIAGRAQAQPRTGQVSHKPAAKKTKPTAKKARKQASPA